MTGWTGRKGTGLGKALLGLWLATGAAAFVRADVRLPALFSSHMVLQQRSKTPIWGWAEPGEKITVRGSWQEEGAAVAADRDGRWMVSIETPPAGGPFTLTVKGQNSQVFEDVMVGEVWICSGQSNMAWTMRKTGADLSVAATAPDIRLFQVEKTCALRPASDCRGVWKRGTPDAVADFSAVAYFFGRRLQDELKVPIGLIEASWGGTGAEAWMSEEALKAFPSVQSELEKLRRMREEPEAVQAAEAEAWGAWALRGRAADAGYRDGWMRPDALLEGWADMDLPRGWNDTPLASFDGAVWFRREVDIPDIWASRDLIWEMGPMDDLAAVWFQGEAVGETARPDAAPRTYRIPGALVKTGRAVLTVRVMDAGDEGGFLGEPGAFRLRPAEPREGDAVFSLAGAWQWKIGAPLAALGALPQAYQLHPNMPTTLYNGMIAPLIPFCLRGAIWYQGESSRRAAAQYQTLFPALIANWRGDWGLGDFPFLYVQIAPFQYNEGDSALVREAQRLALRAVPNVGMAVTMDIGEPANIHPKNKQEVGRRLARWALAKTYGRKEMVYSGPLYASMAVEGGAIRLRFDERGGGLTAQDGKPLTEFAIAGADRKFVPAEARIDGESVVVSSPRVSAPVAVRYAWGHAPRPNLANREGLPASPFRTDDWNE